MDLTKKLRRPMSDQEMQRRWAEVRKLQDKFELDLVLAQSSNMHLGGYARWFTDIPAEYNHHMTVLFPKDGEMTLVRTSASRVPEWVLRGVEQVIYAPFAVPLNYTDDMMAEKSIDYIKNRGFKRVGWIGKANLGAGFMKSLLAALPNVEFIDVTNDFDMIKALKSDEEMECVRDTARIHDAMWTALPAIIKVGMTEYQVRAEVMNLLSNLGTEEHLMFMGTARPHKPCGMNTFQYANRRIQEGDYGTLLIEVNGAGGYWCESARNFCFGEPYKELQDAWDVAVKAQKLTADMLTPGRQAKEIVAKYNAFVEAAGYSTEGRLYGHSQGYDLIERPAFMAKHPFGEEDMEIRVGMNCSLHPYFTDDQQTVYVNDNFYVTENGAERIHKTSFDLILL